MIRVATAGGRGMAGEGGLTDARTETRAAAFDRLTSARLMACYRLATAILGDPVEAEDATHDAAVRAWQRWDSLRDEHKFDGWFGRILVNECRDRLRRRGRLSPPGQFSDATRTNADSDFGDSLAERQALAEALSRLEPDQRIVIVLRFYLGLDEREIAARTGARVGTVKSRLHYALRALRAARDAVDRSDEVCR
jgi:RNA polymerase sigma-70 factor (ECF subfamily)